MHVIIMHTQKKSVLFDTRWFGKHGIGRFALEIYARLRNVVGMPNQKKFPYLLDSVYLSHIIKNMNQSVYFSPGYNPPFYLTTKKPFIFTIHDLTHLKIQSDYYRLKKIYYDILIKPAIKKASAIFAVSEHAKNDILEWSTVSQDRVHVVGNGISEKFVPVGKKTWLSKPYFLFIGNCKPHKNLPRLIKAFALSQLHQDYLLVISGKPDLGIMASAKELRIDHAIFFVGGQLEDTQLSALYRGAYATVVPSLYEGFGLPALESMACGTPVLSSNVASLPEVVGEGGLYFDPYDIENIAYHLKYLAEHAELRESLSQCGIVRSSGFSWDQTTSKVEYVISAL